MQSGSAGCKRETGCMKKRFPVYVFRVTFASLNRGQSNRVGLLTCFSDNEIDLFIYNKAQ